ncbi:MAG TPA: thiolase family protein [Gordonia sp. (in: high G+C Gram-positive bacteria)]|uniref:thiolase family protein n=1 Tax=unclassified Gordonia (in: high G+C Gram-positive bacteria) TaxID=2657482 RepID=UPI000F9E6CE2|nr:MULTISPECIES: thiolase family protein [unclassified Gordonia (in: high G+C Gram-positive bacteria)]RUP36015.1 MAG: thiolase family protein [Gordonia sp. (in: high G+C Gram-positive bacteria)]HNP57262.1 thiolase family protein [Gordonia sp. (in: high G+C Gram-positive bacteria)]HRC49326.1 thiolase family protein [Gordonia sp. (in: high G+C Gram-positive bacteria)]
MSGKETSQFAEDVYIYDAVRTPKGRVRRGGGTLAPVPSYELLGGLLRALADRGLDAERVEDVIIGTSTAFGEQAGDVARAAVLWAQWPDTVPGGTVSRLCCSGFDAIGSAAARIGSGMNEVVVAGGVESMSRVPMLADAPAFASDGDYRDRTGYVTIGVSADLTAAEAGFTREELDAFAVESHRRACAASPSSSVIPVSVGGETLLSRDEGGRTDATVEGFAALPALFGDDPSWPGVLERLSDAVRPEGGLHSMATAPQLADGASAIVLGSAAAAEYLGPPRGLLLAVTQSAVRSPRLTATVTAAQIALQRSGLTPADLAVVEANESFAVSPLLLTRELGLDPAIVNPHGGSVATGHPLGASGGMLLTDALAELERTDSDYALLTIPGALGLGAAAVIARLIS